MMISQIYRSRSKILLASFLGGVQCTTVPKNVDCPVYAVLPPKHVSAAASDYIAASWIKSVRKKLPNCQVFAASSEINEMYHHFGFNSIEPPKIIDITPAMAENLYTHTDTTHVIILDYKLNKKMTKIALEPTVYELASRKKIKTSAFDRQYQLVTKPRRFERAEFYGTANKLLKFLPNSIALGYSTFGITNSRYIEEEKWDTEAVKSNSAMPKIISAFTLTSTIHPAMYRFMDVDYSFYASFVLLNVDNTYTYRKYEAENSLVIAEERQYTLKLFGGGPLANVSGSLFFWKMRAYMEFGYGGGYATASDSLDNNYAKWIALYNFGIGLDFFTFDNKNLFWRIAGNGTGMRPALVENELFKSDSAIYAFIGLGYYIGKLSL